MAFTVVLAANVFYPVTVRNLCLAFADAGFFRPVWTDEISDEWVRNLSNKITPIEARSKRRQIDQHFEDSIVPKIRYEPFESQLRQTHPKDRHVLAAAIAASADMIVSNNIKDFDPDELASFGIDICDCDEFLCNQLDLHPTALSVVEFVMGVRKPPFEFKEYVERLDNSGLIDFATSLQKLKADQDQWNSLQLTLKLADESMH